MLLTCTLCQIVRNGFNKECACKDTYSYRCWGEATYFATRSFACHNYNGGSQSQNSNSTLTKCTIMVKINGGNAFNQQKYKQLCERLIGGATECASVPALLNMSKHDTATFSRDYYIAPVDYILSYNNVAAVPIYIVVYSTEPVILIRTTAGGYCSFHKEYHICSTGCDGHYGPECLGSGRSQDYVSTNYNGSPNEILSYGLRGLPTKLLQELAVDDI
jgi:hypothetical protein